MRAADALLRPRMPIGVAVPHFAIAEFYDDVQVLRGVDATRDARHIADPGYYLDHGPANVAARCLHGAF